MIHFNIPYYSSIHNIATPSVMICTVNILQVKRVEKVKQIR